MTNLQDLMGSEYFEGLQSPIEPTELEGDMAELVEIASEYAIIPPVMVLNDAQHFTGRVDHSSYTHVVILIARTVVWSNEPRTEEQMLRSLAHELGHVIHGGNESTHSFAECEAAADVNRDWLLAQL